MRKNHQLIMVIGAALLFATSVNTSASAIDDGLIKKVDLSSLVGKVKQKYDYWCVYACLESVTGKDQCDYCSDYLRNRLESYYNNGENPYDDHIDSASFNRAMRSLIDSSYGAPCDSSAVYEKFGVIYSDIGDFLEDNDFEQGNSSKFYRQISLPDEDDPDPGLLISIEGVNGHCVVFRGSEYYDNDWFHRDSKILIMNPASDDIETITYQEFCQYSYMYQEK